MIQALEPDRGITVGCQSGQTLRGCGDLPQICGRIPPGNIVIPDRPGVQTAVNGIRILVEIRACHTAVIVGSNFFQQIFTDKRIYIDQVLIRFSGSAVDAFCRENGILYTLDIAVDISDLRFRGILRVTDNKALLRFCYKITFVYFHFF